jgi:hypothetical protein
MEKRYVMSLQERKKNLIKLIEDAKSLGFVEKLILNYENQLKEIERELEQDKIKKSNLKRIERGYK